MRKMKGERLTDRMKEGIRKLFQGGFFHILFGNTLTKMIAFLSSIVIVRLVNKQDYAYLAYADNLYSYINLIAGLGMSTAILKFCGSNISRSEDKAYFLFAMKYGSIFQAGASIALIIYVYAAELPFPTARTLIVLSLLYPLLTNILSTLQNYVRAHMNHKLYVRMGIVQTAVVFAASVVLVLLFGIKGIVFARYLAILLAAVISYHFLSERVSGVEKVRLNRVKIKAFLNMAISLMIASMFSMMLPSNELALVNHLISDEIVTANYKVANLIPSQLMFITNSIVIYFFPLIAKVDRLEDAWKELKRVGILTFAIVGLICVLGMIFSPALIHLVYGNRYTDALGLFFIFWIVYGINAGVRILPMNMLPALGITKFNVVMSIGTCLVHFILDYFLIERVGISGAGLASGAVYLLSGLLYWGYLYWICRRKE